MERADSAIRTINRVCDILNSYGEGETMLTLTEISKKIGIPKSTTHRLMEALSSQGLLNRDSDGRSYRLGYQLIRWGILSQNSLDLRNTALPLLRNLAMETGETAVLSVRAANYGIWIETVESKYPVRLAMRIGKPLHLHAGASSKVLWAFLQESEVEQILNEIDLIPLKTNTITQKDKMRQELDKIRQRGYATSFEETDDGVMGVAAPVFNHTGKPIAGIGIVAPVSRISEDKVPEIAKLVINTGRSLSRLLGTGMD